MRNSEDSDMTDCIVALVTVGSRADGERIAEALVGEQLAACVNIVEPIRSRYRWENRVERDDELLLIIKNRASALPSLPRAGRRRTRSRRPGGCPWPTFEGRL